MTGWLQGEYEAVIFAQDGDAAGYALYRRSPEYVYLRHFYVRPECRRWGSGGAGLAATEHLADARRVRGRAGPQCDGHRLLGAVGFSDYALTLEMDL